MKVLFWLKSSFCSTLDDRQHDVAQVLFDALMQTGKYNADDAQIEIENFHNRAFDDGRDSVDFD